MIEDKGRDHEDQPGGCSKQRGRKWQKPADQLLKCVTSAQITHLSPQITVVSVRRLHWPAWRIWQDRMVIFHLNPSKSEAINFFNLRSKPLQTIAESIETISIAGSPIKPQTSIKNLGVYLDSRLSFDKQVSEICKTSYFHICALRHIRSSLTTEAAKSIASAIVGSRLDYCNSLLTGTSVSNLARLQLVQNTLARVVTQKSRFDHIMPVLSELHWLPVCHRINFKIATHHSQGATVSIAFLPRCTHSTLCTCAITPIFFILVNKCSFTQNLHGNL